jgi:hypothetical protein
MGKIILLARLYAKCMVLASNFFLGLGSQAFTCRFSRSLAAFFGATFSDFLTAVLMRKRISPQVTINTVESNNAVSNTADLSSWYFGLSIGLWIFSDILQISNSIFDF